MYSKHNVLIHHSPQHVLHVSLTYTSLVEETLCQSQRKEVEFCKTVPNLQRIAHLCKLMYHLILLAYAIPAYLTEGN